MEKSLFYPTPNNLPDLISLSGNQHPNAKESNICVVDGNVETIAIGEGSMIRGSVVGRNVQIGAKAKISNSIILGNVKIGSECIIQNALILSKATVADK